jgi:hypothetical protein
LRAPGLNWDDSPLPLHDDADLELDEAASYYEIERPGLGAAFPDESAMSA